MRGDFLVVLDRLLPLMGRDGATFLTRVNSTPSPPIIRRYRRHSFTGTGSRAPGQSFLRSTLVTVTLGVRALYGSAEMFEVGANALKLRDDCVQFGVYLARVASLVLMVIAQCAHSPDQTFQRRGDLIALHWYASIFICGNVRTEAELAAKAAVMPKMICQDARPRRGRGKKI